MQAKITKYVDVVQKTEENDSSQETEIGLTPQGWEVVKLGDILIPVREKIKRDQYNWDLDIVEKIPFDTGRIILRSKRGTKTDLYVSNFGTLVVSKINLHQGAVAINDIGKIACTTHYEVYNLKKSVDIVYFWYFLRSSEFKALLYEDIKFRGFKKEANLNYLESFKICLPPLPEQQKIAKVLGTIQRAIEQQDKIIEAAKNLKKSLMQKLFTKGVRGEEQQESEIGPIPKSWELVGLGDIGNFQYGYTTSALKDPVGPKFLRITDIKVEGRVSWEEVPYCSITESEFSKYKLQAGDIIIARIGATTGKTCIIKEAPKAIFASYLIRMQVQESDKADPSFVYYFTNTPIYWTQINANKEGKLKKGVSASFLKTLKIPLPPIDEQRAIAHILSTLDKKIEVEERRKATLIELFRTMLHKLMTGEIRLKDVEV